MLSFSNPEAVFQTVLDAISTGDRFEEVLNELPVPIYLTDREGAITFWNQACVDMVGREPKIGEDKWCVSWKLLTTEGSPLPKEKCPMAIALKSEKTIRDEIAIALRPDGSRRAFRAYPTPLFDADGDLTGGVNMLIDVTQEQALALDDQAGRCRRLASATHDKSASDVLSAMANDYEATAEALRTADRA